MTVSTWDAHQPEIHQLLASLARMIGLRATSSEHAERLVGDVLLAGGSAVLHSPLTMYSLLAQVMRRLPATCTHESRTDSTGLTALRRLPADAQLLLTLAYWEELSPRDLGQVFACSVREASRRLACARTMLRETERLLADPQRLAATAPDSRHGPAVPGNR